MRGWLKILCALVLFIVLVITLATYLTPRPGPEQKYSVGPALPHGSIQPQLVCTYIGDGILLAPDGSLWLWGGKSSSVGRTGPSPVPVPLDKGHDWRQVAAAFAGFATIKSDGTLWLWTNTGRGKIAPTQFGTETNWTQISGNVSHFMALKRDGTLWGWGQNESSQVGVTNAPAPASTSLPGGATSWPAIIRINSPVQVGKDSDWTAIAAGSFNSYALKRDGTLWEWGSHLNGPLGTTNILEPAQFDSGTNWTAISAGDYHIVALKSDGTIWLAGQNAPNMISAGGRSQTTANATLTVIGQDSDWTELVSGQNCFYARKRDGTWWFLGNYFGQAPIAFLHTGGPVPEKVPYQFDPWAFATGGTTSLLLAKDGNLWSWGPRMGSTIPVSADQKVASFLQSLRAVFRPHGVQAAINSRQQGYGPNSDAIFDNEPHKIWTLPTSMRRSLAKDASAQTNTLPPP